MKKIEIILALFISIFLVNIKVFAATGTLSTSSSSVYVGDSFTVYANINSAAAWNVHVISKGPVTGCSINKVDATEDAMDTNQTFSATCTSIGVGTITIMLSGDVTSASTGEAESISGTKIVTVSNRPSSVNNNTTVNNNKKTVNTKSTNNRLKDISVEGYSLEKVDNNNYKLSVITDVDSINVKATAEDSKATIKGTGNHSLNVGDNNIEVIITSESGSQNKVNIKVTRKDGYYLEDLKTILAEDKNDIDIIISQDAKIAKEDLTKIQESKKIIKFNYLDNEKNKIYGWIIDGSKIKNISELLAAINFESEYKKKISKLSNYSDNMYISFEQKEKIPEGTKLVLYVGNKYEDNDLVNIYQYMDDLNELKLVSKGIKVDKGYIEFNLEQLDDYIITMSNIVLDNKLETPSKKKKTNILGIVITVTILIALIVAVIIYLLKKKKNHTNDKNQKIEEVDAQNYNEIIYDNNN